MEDANRLIGGMNQDSHPSNQPDQTVRRLVNFVPMDTGGNLYSVTNEQGTTLYDGIILPTGFSIIGHSVLNTDIIVILADAAGHSQVGVISDIGTGSYTPIAPNDNGTVPEDNSEFGFDLDHPIDCVSRKLITGERILYYTDNNVPFGRVNLDNPPIVGEVFAQSALLPNASHARITITGINESVASTVVPGAYHMATRYVTKSGAVTEVGNITDPVPIIPSPSTTPINQIHGEYSDDGATSKSIDMTFSEIDTTYAELEVIVVYYSTEGGVQSNVVAQLPISGDTMDYTFSGLNPELDLTLSLEEIRLASVSYNTAKCIEQLDSVLYLSNLTDSSSENDDVLQKVANKVKVSYRIDEIPYCGRGNEGDTEDTELFIPESITQSGSGALEVIYSDPVASATATLIRNGTPPSATIQVVDNALLVVGDILVISTFGAQLQMDLTVVSTPTADGFEIGATAEDTALNITNAIKDHSAFNLFTPTIDGDTVTMFWNALGDTATSTITTIAGLGVTDFLGGNAVASEIASTSGFINNTKASFVFPVVLVTDEVRVVATSTSGEVFDVGDGSLPVSYDSDGSGSFGRYDTGDADYINEEVHYAKKTYRRNEAYSLAFAVKYRNNSLSAAYHIPGYSGNVDANWPVESKFSSPSWGSFNSGLSSGSLGTYVSDQEYPLNQNYPGDQVGDDSDDYGDEAVSVSPVLAPRNVRHHTIPSVREEPHYRVDGDRIWIRLLSLEFNFTEVIPASILEDVAEVIIIRERRHTSQNKSVLAQGFINRGIITADNIEEDTGIVGNVSLSGGNQYENPRNGYYMTEMPFFDNLTGANLHGNDVDQNGDNGAKNDTHTRTGIVYPGMLGHHYNGTYEDGKKQRSDIDNKRAFFHSPEIELDTPFRLDDSDLGGAFVAPLLNIKGDYKKEAAAKSAFYSDPDSDQIKQLQFCDISSSFKDYLETAVHADIDVVNGRYSAPGKHRLDALDDNEPSLRTSTRWTSGGLELVLEDNLPDTASEEFFIDQEIGFKFYNLQVMLADWVDSMNFAQKSAYFILLTMTGGLSSVLVYLTLTTILGLASDFLNKTTHKGFVADSTGAEVSSTAKIGALERPLYNIENRNRAQYGLVSSASYIGIKVIPVAEFTSNVTGVYNGDTFITNFSYNGGQLIHWCPIGTQEGTATNTAFKLEPHEGRGYTQIDGIRPIGSRQGISAWGFDYRWGTSYFVESNINTFYRHNPGDLKQDYFPNGSNWRGILGSYDAWRGNINEYNIQYSYENNIREFYPKASTQVSISGFENRTIYSEQSSEDDTLDTYRQFLSNAYYDLPTHTGPIWDSFVSFNTLYLHTPKCLWKTYANYTPSLQGDVSDVLLGNAGNFQRPAIQTYTDKGGYGGSINQFGGIQTPQGYMFVDALQGKVFLLGIGEKGGPVMKEISNSGLQSYFNNNILPADFDMSLVTTSTAHQIDNPYMRNITDSKYGINGSYDHTLKRALLTLNDGTTLSYSMVTNNWFSFHDYAPNVYIPYDNKLLLVRNVELDPTEPVITTADVWELNVGNRGEYFGKAPSDSIVELVSNKQTGGTKTFQNLKIVSDSFTTDGVKIRDDNFYSLNIINDRMNTGENTLIHGNAFSPTKDEGEVFIKYRNDEYRIAIPRDAVIDNAGDITSPANIYSPQGGSVLIDDNYAFRERIKGDYANITLRYSNENQAEFVINNISTIFNKNIR